jgi:hypothetical protein
MKILALKNIVIDLLRNSIGILKDEDYQRKNWFRHEGPDSSTYIDTACHFMDRSELIFKDPGCIEQLGAESYAMLKKLYDLLVEHVHLTEDRTEVDLLQEKDLLDDPNWHDIQSLSEDVYARLEDFVKRYSYEQ